MSNTWDKYLKESHPRRHSKNPSFSSVLLDEVFRSIDEDNQVPSPSKRKTIKNIEVTSFWDDESVSFSTTSRSNSSDSSFSSGVSSNASCKSSKPIYSKPKNGEDFIKMESKSRAMKLYSNLKKVKQPISPGARLSSFINSLFTSESSKKMKNKNDWVNNNATNTSEISKKKKNKNDGVDKNAIITSLNAKKMINKNDGVIKTGVNDGTSSCSPTSSTSSRSCMRKTYAMNSKARIDNGATRKVRFSHASSIIVDDHSQSYRYKTNVGVKGSRNVENRKEEDESEDGFSDCSDDLFEIDHLGMIGNEMFCDELPVYGTTHVRRSCLY